MGRSPHRPPCPHRPRSGAAHGGKPGPRAVHPPQVEKGPVEALLVRKNLLQALEPKALEEVLLEELAPLLSEEQVVRAQVEVVLHTGRVIRLD